MTPPAKSTKRKGVASPTQRMSTDPRISRRRQAVARSRRQRIAIRIAVLLALVAVGWAVFFSPLLVVRDVKVVGAERTAPEEVAAIADLADDQNILLLSTDAVTRRVEELPWVASADVDRMLPSTLRIKITERTPALVLALGAERWTLDAGGHVLAAGVVGKGLPVLAGVEEDEVEPGADLDSVEATGALTAWNSLQDSLRERVGAIFAPTLERISFSLVDGTVIRYGAPESMPEKNEVLRAILARLESEGRTVEYIDVRVPTHPALGPDTNLDEAEAKAGE